MDMIKASFITMFMILSLPLIVLFSLVMFAWSCAEAVSNWLTEDFKEE